MSQETAAWVKRVILRMATESGKLGVSRMKSEMTRSDAVDLGQDKRDGRGGGEGRWILAMWT